MSASELDQVMDKISSKYSIEIVPLRIGDKTLQVLQLKNFEDYLEELIDTRNVGIMDLPYWAKIWDASLLLAYYLGRQPVVLGQRVLEIGAGMGIVGIYAAHCGHKVTLTDIDEDALLFAKANALLNETPQLDVVRLDWNDADISQPYDVIVGSEVLYDRKSYPTLVQFLRRALAPHGIIFLAKNAELNTPAFFAELTNYFEFKQTIQTVRSSEEELRICLYAIRRKSAVS